MSGFEDVPMFDPAGNPVDAPESPPEPVTGHLAEGRRRKESGQAQAATAAAWWTDAAMRWFTRLEAGAWVTADDLIEAIGLPNESVANRNNSVGAVFSGAAKAGLIEPTNQVVKSSRRESHARRIVVWRRK